MAATPVDINAINAQTFPHPSENAQGLAESLTGLQQRHVYLSAYTPQNKNCQGANSGAGAVNTLGTVQKTTSTALSGISGVASTIGASLGGFVSAIPIIGAILAPIFGIFGAIFAHHAQAVALENQTLCTVIPEVNTEFDQLDAELAGGDISLAEYDADLASVGPQFQGAVSGILKEDSGHCNAACYANDQVAKQIALRRALYTTQPFIYYVKKYWYIGALGIGIFAFAAVRRHWK
jgi:hypothetical protein